MLILFLRGDSVKYKNLLRVFLSGAFFYGSIEIIWRGYTHISMLFLGGICFSLIYLCEKGLPTRSVLLRSVIYALLITGLEFISGIILNIVLKLDVWNYVGIPFNILGQICLPYSLLWFVVALICTQICCLYRFAFEE